MKETDLLDRVVSTALTLAALAVVVVVLRREFLQSPGPVALAPTSPHLIEDWESRVDERLLNRIGSVDAPVQIAVFFDLECPFCARFDQEVMAPFLLDRPADVSVSFIHYPLSIHRFAEPAAKAFECATAQGVMLPFMQRVYAQADSLGLKSWSAYAAESGVTDLGAFQACVDEPGLPGKVSLGLSLAENLKIRGTPTIVVNGWDFASPPDIDDLYEAVDRVRRGDPPFEVR